MAKPRCRNFIKKRLGRIASAVLLSILALSLAGGSVLAYLYRAPISISENVSTSYTMLPVLWTQNNDWLADNGFMNSTGNNTRVQTLGGLNKPWMVADNKTLTAIPVPANSQTNLYFVTGESESSAFDIIVGYGGYITIPDDASIEFGDNFSNRISGVYLKDSGWVSKKVGACGQRYDADTDNLTAVVFHSSSANITLLPNGAGLYTNIPTANPVVAHYLNVDDPVATPDDDTTYVQNTTTNLQIDAYNVSAPTIPDYYDISSVKVYFRIRTDAEGISYAKPVLFLGSDNSSGTLITHGLGTYVTYSQTLTRPGGGNWQKSDLDDLQVGMIISAAAGRACLLTQVYVAVYYYGADGVATLTGVTEDEHDIAVISDNTTMGLGIDIGENVGLINSDGLVLNLPFHHTDMTTNNLTSKDIYEHAVDVYGATWMAQGRSFGGSDFIKVPDHDSLDLTADCTLSFWFKPSDLATDFTRLIHKQAVWNVTNYSTDNTLTLFTYSDGGQNVYSSAIFVENEWQLATVTKEDTAVKWYRNGVYDRQSTFTSAAFGTNTNDVYIGIDEDETTLGYSGILGEIWVYNRALTPAEIQQDYLATKWRYDDSISASSNSDSYFQYVISQSVPDTSANLTLSNFAYMESFEIDKGGVRQLYYQPDEMIVGTTLPDREGSNDGVITWGSNPAGVGAVLGSMSSSGQTDIGAASDTSTSDILPVTGGSDWRPAPTVSATLQANPMRPIVTAISDNTTLSEYQVWVWLGIIFVVFITVLVGANVRGHHLITGIAASGAIVLLIVWTVFPLLSLIIVVLAIWGGLVSERSPSL